MINLSRTMTIQNLKIKLVLNVLLGLLYATILFFLLLKYIPADSLPQLNILAVLTPYVLLSCVPILILHVALRNWIHTGICAVLFVLSISTLLKFYSFGGTKSTGEGITLLSYNTTFFNIPKVFKKNYYDSTYDHTVDELRPWLLQQNPDIICLQEFFNDQNYSKYNTIGQLAKAGYYNYMHAKPKHDNGLRRGVATFSKYPIVSAGLITASDNNYNAAIYCDLRIEDDTLRVVNVHLKSVAFKAHRYSLVNKVKRYFVEYGRASYERKQQVKELVAFVKDSPYPVVMAGDFNETPYSNAFYTLSKSVKNIHETLGSGLEQTFTIFGPLGVRIDHVLSTEQVEPMSFDAMQDVKYSEHYPVKTIFRLAD